jgi:hypothetical protein
LTAPGRKDKADKEKEAGLEVEAGAEAGAEAVESEEKQD